jgi:hypothetical protein
MKSKKKLREGLKINITAKEQKLMAAWYALVKLNNVIFQKSKTKFLVVKAKDAIE